MLTYRVDTWIFANRATHTGHVSNLASDETDSQHEHLVSDVVLSVQVCSTTEPILFGQMHSNIISFFFKLMADQF